MVLFLGGPRCVAADVPDALVYDPVYIPPLLGRRAHHMGPASVGRYSSFFLFQASFLSVTRGK